MNSTALPADGLKRVIIKDISPVVANGKYAAKATIGYPIHFSANIISDGHDKLYCRLLYKFSSDKKWHVTPLTADYNDRWFATIIPQQQGILEFKVQAWVSELLTWKEAYKKKEAAKLNTAIDQQHGFSVLEKYVTFADKPTQKQTTKLLTSFTVKSIQPEDIPQGLMEQLSTLAPPERITSSAVMRIDVERKKAGFSTWYELFPRSCTDKPETHGTLRDVARKLPLLADAGFDVLYLPPIHPIGKIKRKGRNNSLTANENDPGSPWAIGSDEGGHKAIHPQLGTLDDFKYLIKEAKKHDIDIAMDIAFQCAPDHPYVKEHPEWFKWRPDGTVQFAENPPKKYEDILPFDFEGADWRALWQELLSVFQYWIKAGVTIFRVDNPHTKSLRLWEWIIDSIRAEHPDVIFLAEAFTRPNIMEQLAMAGFTQSYTYFTWRNTANELKEYLTELTKTDKQHFFRPNFWPNTPDILPEHLVTGGNNMHIIRVLLAATLSSNYGLYGPVYERGINQPMPGKEEYIDNEKYEIKHWPEQEPSRIWKTVKTINQIRRRFAALQVTNNIQFLESSNEQLLAFMKYDEIERKHLLIVITLDAAREQTGWVKLPIDKLNDVYGLPLQIRDEFNDDEYTWSQDWNYIALDAATKPAHVFSFLNAKQ